jgi:pimeloyl-ACP methyl ester carboxylesterase
MSPPIGRPIRKGEIELTERGVYIESWLPERRSRRKPLLFVHGELGGSWVWERFLGYFAGRGWEGHALNLRNHFWSQTADPAELSFATYVEDVAASMRRFGPSVVVVGHGMGALLALKAAERAPPCSSPPSRPPGCDRRPSPTSCARSPRSTARA